MQKLNYSAINQQILIYSLRFKQGYFKAKMDSIQQQINTLTNKVERIYQIVDRLHQHVTQEADLEMFDGEETSTPPHRHHHQRLDSTISRRGRSSDKDRYNNGYADLPSGSHYRYDNTEWVMTQQDILIDSSGVEISHHQIKEQDLSPQIQIQRLTAQLTAAYNRIAALEEQLLAKRWK